MTFRHYVNAIIDMGFPKGMNPLHFSAYYGDIEHLRYVIQFDDIRADDTMENGNTALHLAAQNGFSEICYILAKGQTNAYYKLNYSKSRPIYSKRIQSWYRRAQ